MMDVAIEFAEAADRGARRLGHENAVAARAGADAGKDAVGPLRDPAAHERGIGGKPAIGDDDRAGADLAPFALRRRLDADAGAVLDEQRIDLGAAQNLAAAPHEIALEALHQQVGAAPLPIEARAETAARRHDMGAAVHGAECREGRRVEARAFADEPVMRALRVPRDGGRELGLRRSVRALDDRGEEPCPAGSSAKSP